MAADPRLLKQVGDNARAYHFAALIKLDIQQLPKPRRVVISDRLGIAKALQNRVCLHQLGGDCYGRGACVARYGLHEAEAHLGGLCLACARFATDKYRLVPPLIAPDSVHHASVRSIHHPVRVRRELVASAAPVHLAEDAALAPSALEWVHAKHNVANREHIVPLHPGTREEQSGQQTGTCWQVARLREIVESIAGLGYLGVEEVGEAVRHGLLERFE
eukprot:3456359-Prymnesium_polylepis.1